MEKINLTSSQIAWLKSQTKENWFHLFRAYAELEKFASEKDEDMFYDIMGNEDNFTVDEWEYSEFLIIDSEFDRLSKFAIQWTSRVLS